MNTSALRGALAGAALALVAPLAAADSLSCDPVSLQWSQPSYTLGETISLTVSGTPGSLGLIFMNTDPGPFAVPGLGIMGVGPGPGLKSFKLRPIPASGSLTFECNLLCINDFLADTTFYLQAVTVSPASPCLCLSNVAELVITDAACIAEGCTPGLWKNKTQHWVGTGYSPGDDFDSVFGVDLFDPDITLLTALQDVGPNEKIFSAHATAALLNSTSPDVNYTLTEAQVIQMVQDAVLSGDLEPLKDKFDALNNSGCPL